MVGYPYTNPMVPAGPWQGWQQPQSNLIKCKGFEGAWRHMLPPNSAVALFDEDDSVFYLKTTDAAGNADVRIFRFQEDASRNITTGGTAENTVSKEEFEEFKAMIMKEVLGE